MYLDNAYQFSYGLASSPFRSSWGLALFAGAVPENIEGVSFDMSKADEVFKNAECQMNIDASIINGDSVRFLRGNTLGDTLLQNKIHFFDEVLATWYFIPQEANVLSTLKDTFLIQDKLTFMSGYGSIFNPETTTAIDFDAALDDPKNLEIEYVFNEEVTVSAIHAKAANAAALGTTLHVFVRDAGDTTWTEIGTGLTNAFSGLLELGDSATGTKFKVVSTCTNKHSIATLLLCGDTDPTQSARPPVTWAMIYPLVNPSSVYEVSKELPVIIMDAGGPEVQLPLTLNSATAIAEIPFNVINLKISSPYLEETV